MSVILTQPQDLSEAWGLLIGVLRRLSVDFDAKYPDAEDPMAVEVYWTRTRSQQVMRWGLQGELRTFRGLAFIAWGELRQGRFEAYARIDYSPLDVTNIQTRSPESVWTLKVYNPDWQIRLEDKADVEDWIQNFTLGFMAFTP